jgi:hypothetical protein
MLFEVCNNGYAYKEYKCDVLYTWVNGCTLGAVTSC